MEDTDWINTKYLKKLGFNTDKMTTFEINALKKDIASKMRTEHLKSFLGDNEDCIL